MESIDNNLKCSSLVVKVASRCNLNCTYCYMYNMGDSTYKNQPKVMPDAVVDAMLEKTLLHCIRHGIREFAFVFHGGEPLLAGFEFYEKFVSKALDQLLPDVKPIFVIQTNATLLTEEWCKLLGRLQIQVGISLDGTPEDNDMFRIDHAGKGSYEKIIRGLKIAQQSPFLINEPGILSVLNVNADPIKTYEHLKGLRVKRVNFLFPDSTYDQPPPQSFTKNETAYADWLIQLFDRWLDEPNGERINISLFEGIIMAILGIEASDEFMGSANNELLVIETNGGIEAVDVLRICGDGFTKRNANVLTHEFDDAMENDLAKLYNLSHKKLCKQCMACPVKDICGGGYLPHRYSHKSGFNNPSVYCHDLLKLITHIQNKVLEQMPDELLNTCDVDFLSFENAKEMMQESAHEYDEQDCADELLNFS
jgi:uncharacterized protein